MTFNFSVQSLTNKNESTPEDDGISWGAKFPPALAEAIRHQVKELGYMSISEYIRTACREKTLAEQSRHFRQIVDILLSSGKITVGDLKEAIYTLSMQSVPT